MMPPRCHRATRMSQIEAKLVWPDYTEPMREGQGPKSKMNRRATSNELKGSAMDVWSISRAQAGPSVARLILRGGGV